MQHTIENKFVTIVSGLPRSGTSMMMRALSAGGIEILIDNIRKADDDNPHGYFEYEPVKKTKDDPSWLSHALGKAVKMVYRLLYDLPSGYEYRIVFMQRQIEEVLASQKKMLQRSGKEENDPSGDEQIATLFKAELEKCQQWLNEKPNFSVLYINHRDMINQPEPQALKINEFLGGGLDISAMVASVDPTLYRNRSDSV